MKHTSNIKFIDTSLLTSVARCVKSVCNFQVQSIKMPIATGTYIASNGNREDADDIPIIDVQEYMNNGKLAKEQCRKVADSLRQHGILIVRDTVK